MILAANARGQLIFAALVFGLLALFAGVYWLERRRLRALQALFEGTGFRFARRPANLDRISAGVVIGGSDGGWYRLKTAWIATGCDLDRSVDVVEQVRQGKHGYFRTRIAVSCRTARVTVVSPASWFGRSKHGQPFLPDGEPLGDGWYLVRGHREDGLRLLSPEVRAERKRLGGYVSVFIGDGFAAACRVEAVRTSTVRRWITETV